MAWVDRAIHNTVAADTEYFNELESSSINEGSDSGVDGGSGGGSGLGRHDGICLSGKKDLGEEVKSMR